MSSVIRLPQPSIHLLRSVAVTALLGATLLANAAIAADPDAANGMAPVAAHAAHHQTVGDMKGETVEQRIAGLHKSLKITVDEETNWAAVADAMRANDAAMKKLSEERRAEAPQNVSAVDDLKTYEKFTQAHVDGLKGLISSFETLYGSMPDSQKALADQVFQSVGHESKAASR